MNIVFTPEIEPLMPRPEMITKSALPQLSAKIEELSASPWQSNQFVNEASIAHFSNLIENLDSSEKEIDITLNDCRSATFDNIPDSAKILSAAAVARRVAFSATKSECLFSCETLQKIHHSLIESLPERARVLGDDAVTLTGGRYRLEEVIVGTHLAPPPNRISSLMSRYSSFYNTIDFSHPLRFIAIAAAHHRLMWIHPFLDGNGRVARIHSEFLFYHCANKHPATQNLNRELYKTVDEYRRNLSLADSPRQGNFDGRGALSEKFLIAFCEYFLEAMLRALSR